MEERQCIASNLFSSSRSDNGKKSEIFSVPNSAPRHKEWLVSRPGRFTPYGRIPGAQRTGGWMVPEAVRTLLRREISFAHAGNRTTTPKSSIKIWEIVNDIIRKYVFKEFNPWAKMRISECR
jgi:hypothetical protein